MITDMKEDDFIGSMNRRPSRLAVNLGYAQNRFFDTVINWMKRHITREDIDKFKRKIGK